MSPPSDRLHWLSEAEVASALVAEFRAFAVEARARADESVSLSRLRLQISEERLRETYATLERVRRARLIPEP